MRLKHPDSKIYFYNRCENSQELSFSSRIFHAEIVSSQLKQLSSPRIYFIVFI